MLISESLPANRKLWVLWHKRQKAYLTLSSRVLFLCQKSSSSCCWSLYCSSPIADKERPPKLSREVGKCRGSPGQPADWLSPQLCTYRQCKTVIDSLSSLWSRSEREKAVIPRLPPRPCFQSINSSRGFPHIWVEFPQKRRKCFSEYHVLFPLLISFFLLFILMCSPRFLFFSSLHRHVLPIVHLKTHAQCFTISTFCYVTALFQNG